MAATGVWVPFHLLKTESADCRQSALSLWFIPPKGTLSESGTGLEPPPGNSIGLMPYRDKNLEMTSAVKRVASNFGISSGKVTKLSLGARKRV